MQMGALVPISFLDPLGSILRPCFSVDCLIYLVIGESVAPLTLRLMERLNYLTADFIAVSPSNNSKIRFFSNELVAICSSALATFSRLILALS